MLRNNSEILYRVHQIIDLCLVVLCFHAAYLTRTYSLLVPGVLINDIDYNFVSLLAVMAFHTSLRLFGVYEPFRHSTISQMILKSFKATLGGVAGLVFFCYILHIESVSRLFIVIFSFYIFTVLSLFKCLVFQLLTKFRRHDYNIRYILIIGSKQRSQDFINSVMARKESGYRIIGALELVENADAIGREVCQGVKVTGTMKDFKRLLKSTTIDEIVFGIPLKKIKNINEYIYFAEEMGKNVRILPDFQINKVKYYPKTASVEIASFLGITTLVLSSGPKNSNELILKAIFDYTGALIGLIFLSPFFLLIALIIKLTSKGPVFYSQQRVGLNGRCFRLYKFRTMVEGADELKKKLLTMNEMDGPAFKIEKDPRITRVGRVLRKMSLDEFPQLINVLKGEMSLVGPRPPLLSEVGAYKLWQRRRLSMKPGLTCTWQVTSRNNTSFEQWMNMDLEYIDNWSIGLDIKLLLMTVKAIASGSGR